MDIHTHTHTHKNGALNYSPFPEGGEGDLFSNFPTGLFLKAGLFVFVLLLAALAYSSAPNALAAVEGLTLEDEAYLEFQTTDTASTTILSAQGGAGKITVTVEDDYVDVFMQKGATLTLDSEDGVAFTVQSIEGDPRNWTAEKRCPTPDTSRLKLDSKGGPATLRITISSGPACAAAAENLSPFNSFLTLLTRFFSFLFGLI